MSAGRTEKPVHIEIIQGTTISSKFPDNRARRGREFYYAHENLEWEKSSQRRSTTPARSRGRTIAHRRPQQRVVTKKSKYQIGPFWFLEEKQRRCRLRNDNVP